LYAGNTFAFQLPLPTATKIDMADIKNVNQTGLQSLTPNQVQPTEMPTVPQTSAPVDGVQMPVGQPGELGQPTGMPAPPGGQILTEVIIGKESSQLQATEQMRERGGISATDKLLGLHLQPTMSGAIQPPPGNSEALRHLTPAMRRSVIRKLLNKQRDSTLKLAKFVRRERDERDDDENSDSFKQESFLELMQEEVSGELEPINRATLELGKMTQMLDLLDELLILQDYAVSQMGTFSQG
jgi:hypothetical protein